MYTYIYIYVYIHIYTYIYIYTHTYCVEENGNPLKYSCLENSMDGGNWQVTVHGVTKSRPRLSTSAYIYWEAKKIPVTHFTAIFALLWWSGIEPSVSPRYAGMSWLNRKW